MTRWIRFVAAEDRAHERQQTHVCDHQLRTVQVEDWNLNAALHQIGDEPFVMVEWDIAFDPLTMRIMEHAIGRAPDDVHVAPYWLYPQSTGLLRPVLAHRVRTDAPERYRWMTWFERERCDAFGLGLTYWPRPLLELARTLPLNHDGADTVLSDAWGRGAHVVWEAEEVVHLHWSYAQEVDAKA